MLQTDLVRYVTQKTRHGWLMMAQSDVGICFAEFAANKAAVLQKLRDSFPQSALVAENSASHSISKSCQAMVRYLEGTGRYPSATLDLRGTPFQKEVWHQLQKTTAHQTLSYSALAKRIGAPKAIRAVASACAANRIAVLVPCHRALRADGGLGGYRWGLTLKKHLLDLERRRH